MERPRSARVCGTQKVAQMNTQPGERQKTIHKEQKRLFQSAFHRQLTLAHQTLWMAYVFCLKPLHVSLHWLKAGIIHERKFAHEKEAAAEAIVQMCLSFL